MNYCVMFAGLIATTSRRLDREQQGEHILEVNDSLRSLKYSESDICYEYSIQRTQRIEVKHPGYQKIAIHRNTYLTVPC